MSSIDVINFISKRLNLTNVQVEMLKELPDGCWLKCSQAIIVSERRGYPLKIEMIGLLENKPDPRVEFIHTYDIKHRTKEYRHTINIEIKV